MSMLKVGAKYIKNTKTGIVYPYSNELEGHSDCVVFVHQEKPAARRAPAPPAPVRELDIVQPTSDGLPDSDPALLGELEGLVDLDDPEGDPQ